MSSTSTLARETSKHFANGQIHVCVIGFRDRIYIRITNEGQVSPVLYVPLGPMLTLDRCLNTFEPLPDVRFTPHPLLASTKNGHGEMYAVNIATLITRQAAQEGRTLVLSADGVSEASLPDVLSLVSKARVW